MILTHWILIAQTPEPDLVPSALQNMGRGPRDIIIVVIAAALIVAAVVVWAVFIRKRPKDDSRWAVHHSSHSTASETESAEGSQHRRYHRRRRRRREHRPRNPTLAETGGLPPVRHDKPQEPAP